MPRLKKTLADYVTIAISPVLIMALVGSLVFFLQEVFYEGRYEGRVNWILGLFVMAIVLIGRISIEESNERAALFALPLAVAVGLAINKFGGGGWLHWGLMALCWWSAHKLTWDCTVIDEDKDASGQGLLQIVGLDGSGQAEFEAPDKEPGEEEEIGTSYSPVTASWEKEEKKKRKPHAPGVWIVFFSLAALPLFGIGQRFIPVTDIEGRRTAFGLLLVYVASGLGLLLTTSFLGLRRYLRQRRVEMPASMATVWIASGGGLIVALLLFAALLPRPAAEYAISRVPLSFESPELKSSKYAVGKDGADQNSPDSKSATSGDESRSDEKQSDEESKSSGSSDSRQQPDDDRQSPPDDSKQGGDSGHDDSKPGESGKPSDEGKGESGKSSGKGESQQGKSSEQGKQSDKSDSQKGKSSEQGKQSGKNDSQKGKSSEQGKQSDKNDSQKGKSSEQGKQSDKSDSQQGKSSEQGKQEDTSRDDASRSDDSKRPDKPPDSSEESSQKRDKSRDPSDRDSEQDSPEDKNEGESDRRQSREEQTAQDEGEEASPPSSFSFLKLLSSLMGGLGGMLKWLFYIALLLAALYWLVRSWKTVMAAWTQFLKELAEFWQRLFGGKPTPEEQAAAAGAEESKPAPRPFADFADPFATGTASRHSPDELVRYTFEAVEAWARENGFPRKLEQTPHEFARQLSAAAESLGDNSRTLADLYCYVAYAPGRLRAERTEALAQLWQQLRPG